MRSLSNVVSSAQIASAMTLEEIEPDLDTGDVILFSRTGPNSLVARLGPWHHLSTAGFLIRDREGLDGLRICHPSLAGDPPEGNTEIRKLRDFAANSDYETVVIRRLCMPLNNQQIQDVEQFSENNVGVVLNRKVTLLMQRTDIPSICICALCLHLCSKTVERFICSELVVKMLNAAGRVEGEANEYYPVESDVRSRRRWRVYGHSTFVKLS